MFVLFSKSTTQFILFNILCRSLKCMTLSLISTFLNYLKIVENNREIKRRNRIPNAHHFMTNIIITFITTSITALVRLIIFPQTKPQQLSSRVPGNRDIGQWNHQLFVVLDKENDIISFPLSHCKNRLFRKVMYMHIYY